MEGGREKERRKKEKKRFEKKGKKNRTEQKTYMEHLINI